MFNNYNESEIDLSENDVKKEQEEKDKLTTS